MNWWDFGWRVVATAILLGSLLWAISAAHRYKQGRWRGRGA